MLLLLSEKTFNSLSILSKKIGSHTREDLYVILRSGKAGYEDKTSSSMTAFLKLHELELPKDWRSQPLFVALYIALPNDVSEETFKVVKIANGEKIGHVDSQMYYSDDDEEYEYCDYDGRSHTNEWYEYTRTYSEYISHNTVNFANITRRPIPIPENFVELVTEFSETFPCTLNLERLEKFLPSEGSYSIPKN